MWTLVTLKSDMFTFFFSSSWKALNSTLLWVSICVNHFILMAGYFWEASHLEVDCIGFWLFITPELLFGLYLLYYFRVFERQIGSNNYSVSKHLAQISYEFKFNTYVLLLRAKGCSIRPVFYFVDKPVFHFVFPWVNGLRLKQCLSDAPCEF